MTFDRKSFERLSFETAVRELSEAAKRHALELGEQNAGKLGELASGLPDDWDLAAIVNTLEWLSVGGDTISVRAKIALSKLPHP